MKKLFTLVVLMCLLGVNRAWADRLTFRFPTSGEDNYKVVTVNDDEWHTIDWPTLYYGPWNNLTNRNLTAYNEDLNDYTWSFVNLGVSIKVNDGEEIHPKAYKESGNNPVYRESVNDDNNFARITGRKLEFKGREGSILVTAKKNDFIASFKIQIIDGSYQKAVWDFNRLRLIVGRDSDYPKNCRFRDEGNWWVLQSQGASNTPFYFRNNTQLNNQSVDFIEETRGLKFTTNQFAMYNENDTLAPVTNRFIALKGQNSSFTIPGSYLKKGDRIAIQMDKFGQDLELGFTNAQDVFGKPINDNNGTYKIGGTPWDKSALLMGSYYNFIVANDNQDFTVTMKNNGGTILKIYRIVVYSGDFKVDNTIIAGNYQGLHGYTITNNWEKSTDWRESTLDTKLFSLDQMYYLHFRGKGEGYHVAEVLSKTGNLSSYTSDFFKYRTTGNGQTDTKDFVLTDDIKSKISNNKLFGAYKLRIKILDENRNYITDYADRIMAFGYIEKVDHPITWDFTDLKTWWVEEETYLQQENAYAADDMNLWVKDSNNDWTLNYTRSNPDGARFSWGSQLYAGNKMFDETRGIGFAPITGNMSNTSLKIVDGGLRIEDKDGLTDADYLSRGWELTIHDMDGLAALYMRLEPIAGKTPRVECEYYRSQEDGAQGIRYTKEKVLGTNDYVYGSTAGLFWEEADGEQGRGAWKEFKIRLNNVILKKIGTSKDQKMISKPGYATESRRRDIDHSLTSYFTGLPIEAYTGYLPTEGDYSKVVLKRIDNDDSHKVLPASTVGIGQSNTGCILYNNVDIDETNGKSTVAGLDRGIHLFVPDMHDTDKTIDVNDLSGTGSNHKNILLSFKPTYNYFIFNEQDKTNPENYIYKEEGNDLRFILSAKKYKYGTNGSGVETGYDVFFIRIDPNAKNLNNEAGWAYLMQNCAYMRIPKDKVKELTSGSTNGAKMSIVFEDEWFGEINNGIATGIDQVTSNKSQVTSAEWYNLNGQKLNGMPTEKGLYIVNGRKVMIK